jgi:large subunit ribosomal protein L18
MLKVRAEARVRRHRRARKKIHGTAARPRLCVFRSLKHIYAQIIDDDQGKTLAATSTGSKAGKIVPSSNAEAAKAVGKQIAALAKLADIQTVVFDRGGYLYHGNVKALAEAAREGGLVF